MKKILLAMVLFFSAQASAADIYKVEKSYWTDRDSYHDSYYYEAQRDAERRSRSHNRRNRHRHVYDNEQYAPDGDSVTIIWTFRN